MNTSPRLPRRALTAGLATLGLLAGACTADTDPVGTEGSVDLNGNDVVLTSASLSTAGSCDELLELLITEGVERVGPYGFGQGGYWPGIMEGDMAMEASATDSSGGTPMPATTVAASDEGSSAGADGTNYSGTNNQETGVDEPDIVKTDGERMVVAQGNRVQVIDLATDTLTRTIQLDDDMYIERMFLVGDRALVMAGTWTDTPLLSSASDVLLPNGVSVARMIEVDLGSGDIVSSIEVEGWTLSARDTDGTVRLVVSSDMSQRFPFLFPSNEGAEDSATKANQDLLRESTIEQWIPTYRITDGSGNVTDEGAVVPCDAFHLPGEFSGFGALTVLTLDPTDGLQITDRLAVLSNGQTVYASTDRLTIATQSYPVFDWRTGEPVGDEEEASVKLHNFDTTVANETDYVASGAVSGHLLSQYSLSEYGGYLRVATTEGSQWWGSDETSESFVRVLDEVDGELVEVGSVGGLGKGEQIYAVRFIADTAYVVTFRQVDPLYAVDLSDPTAPTVLGELKIPGFSTYLHPIDDGMLFGVGQDATDEGRTTGSQVSTFDVSDLTAPARIDQLLLAGSEQQLTESYTSSSVDWDPLAFTWWAPTRTAFVPISWWGYDEDSGVEDNGAAVVAVQVAADGTLTAIGRLSQATTEQCERWTEEVYVEEAPADDATDDATDEAPATTLAPESAPADVETTTTTGDAEAGFAGDDDTVIADPPAGTTRPIEQEYCWTWQPEIRRTVIVDDAVYTISDAGVGVHALDGFAERTFIAFEQ